MSKKRYSASLGFNIWICTSWLYKSCLKISLMKLTRLLVSTLDGKDSALVEAGKKNRLDDECMDRTRGRSESIDMDDDEAKQSLVWSSCTRVRFL
jgi:hypothetical protein